MSPVSPFRDDLFDGANVLVTGGGSGIGLGIARAFAAHGASVVITSRKLDKLEEQAARIRDDHGTPCVAMASDVRDPEAVEQVVQRAVEGFGPLSVVVNAAAGNFLAPAAGLSPKGYRTVLDIDAVGTFTVSKAAFNASMRDHGGVILNISATLQYLGTPLQIHAASAKAAVDQQTRTLAVEWGSAGVRVVGIAPGPIDDTEGLSRLAPPQLLDKLTRRIPLGRLGRRRDIADAALFLCSDAASWISGETLVVDGGQWLAGLPFDLEDLGAAG